MTFTSWVSAGVLALIGAIGGVVAVLHSHEKPALAAEQDIPHVEGHAIVFSEKFAARAGVKAVPVVRTPLTPVVQVPGTVTFDSAHVSAAGTRIRGFVRHVFKVEGDAVKKGEPLAEIESVELGSAQAEFAVAAAKKRAAERNAARESDLLAHSLTTAREEEVARSELEEQKAMLAAASQRVGALGGAATGARGTYLVHSPIQGTIVERGISAGQSVEADLVAFRLAELDYLWIELHVFEREIGDLHRGDHVEITPAGDRQKKIEGTVTYVGEVIDPVTRSGEVRVKFDNTERVLRPGQSVVARVRPATLAREALVVPVVAITYIDGRPHVFSVDVPDAAGAITRVLVTEVKLGMSDGEQQEIVRGVVEGQKVVTVGVFALKSELFR
ncbi:MAG: efflux RND transporter periplasmic adaptor subunit [Polyangiaceae bacterium]